jgi:hypothetical protein
MNRQTEKSDGGADNGKVDMSPEAIDGRLDMVSALYDLGKYLQTARPVDDDADAQRDH